MTDMLLFSLISEIILNEVSLKRFYFALFDNGHTLNWGISVFAFKLFFVLFFYISVKVCTYPFLMGVDT